MLQKQTANLTEAIKNKTPTYMWNTVPWEGYFRYPEKYNTHRE